VNELLARTACGLYVVPDGHPLGWSNFTWHTTVADMPGDQEEYDALALVQQELRQVTGVDRAGMFAGCTDTAFAALHAGHIPRAPHADLQSADPEVPGDLDHADRASLEWTVCGVLGTTWRASCLRVNADGPRIAYFRAWEWAQANTGEHMLLAAVHEGWQPPINAFGYADPWARDETGMASKLKEWGC